MKDVILFDYDGTLMDTEEVILRSFEETFRVLGRDCPSRDFLRGTFGEPLAYTMGQLFPEGNADEALTIYRSYNKAHFLDFTRPFPGMEETIRALRERGCKTGIVTARLAKTTYLGLEQLGLLPLFDGVVTEEDCEESKPEPGPLYRVLEKMGLSLSEEERRERVLYVGDTVHDYYCARNAGVPIALVAWASSLQIEEKGSEAGEEQEPVIRARATGERLTPDYLIRAAEELLPLTAQRSFEGCALRPMPSD